MNGGSRHAALGASLSAALMLTSLIAYSLWQPGASVEGSGQVSHTQTCRRFLSLLTRWQQRAGGEGNLKHSNHVLSRGGRDNWFLDASRCGRGWFWINSQMSEIGFLKVNWQRNVDGTREAELGRAAVQHPDSRWRAHNKKTWDGWAQHSAGTLCFKSKRVEAFWLLWCWREIGTGQDPHHMKLN